MRKLRQYESRLPQTALVATVLAIGLLAGSTRAVGPETERSLRISAGRASYRAYCSNCHGDEGKGDGQIVQWLKIPPSDLTQLSRASDGEFPTEDVYRVIDGREEVRTHGRREMPIWGDALQEPEADPDQEARVKKKIDALVEYLRDIQEKSAD